MEAMISTYEERYIGSHPVSMNYTSIVAQERAGRDVDGYNHELLYRATMRLADCITEYADAAERRGDIIDATLSELRESLTHRVN